MPKKTFDEADLRDRLNPQQFEVTQNAGTEPAFTGIYHDAKDDGLYRCIVCNEALFDSTTKYNSGTGWPSFWQPIDESKVELHEDRAYGMVRTEVTCATCGAHLGHVFDDGPQPTGERFCMNSASLLLDTERTDAADTTDAPTAAAD